jgi:hypothetical protein
MFQPNGALELPLMRQTRHKTTQHRAELHPNATTFRDNAADRLGL